MLKWDKSGVIQAPDSVIDHTNIAVLLKDLQKPQKRVNDDMRESFKQLLTTSTMPIALISNPKYFGVQSDKSVNQEPPTNSKRSTEPHSILNTNTVRGWVSLY
jgi:hypothetical protein